MRNASRAGVVVNSLVACRRREVTGIRHEGGRVDAARRHGAVGHAALEGLQESERQAIELLDAVVHPDARTVPLIDGQVAVRIVPRRLLVFRILKRRISRRTRGRRFAVDVPPRMRQRVGRADFCRRRQAQALLRC